MITGRKCKLTVSGQTVEAEIVIASDNLKSVMLSFDAAVSVSGGLYCGNMALLFDEGMYAYRDLLTGTPVEVDWGCAKCNQRYQGHEIFNLGGERGKFTWDVGRARALVADGKHEPQPVPDWMLERFLEVNAELDAPEHLDHVDPSQPGIVAQRFGGMFLLDGTYRAHRCKRDGLTFTAYALGFEESNSLLISSEDADLTPEVTAGELRGILKNNPHIDRLDAVLACNGGEDPLAAEAAIRAHLTPDENAKLKLEFRTQPK